MTETLRIEQVVNAISETLKKRKSPITLEGLQREVSRVIPGEVREGDVRAAVWQLIDGGEAQFTTDRKIASTATAVAD